MPRFSYTARDQSDRTVSAVLEAASRKDALRVLAARGLTPMNVSEAESRADIRAKPAAGSDEAGSAGARSRQHRRIRRVRRAQRLPFLQALSDLTGSGMSAGEAVRLLGQRLQEPALRALCQGLWERLSEGQPLSRAMEQYAGVFDSSTVSLIQAGEATGSLNDVLHRLIEHFTELRELRQKLTTAMAYPVFICCVAFGVLALFIFGLLPRL